MNKVGRIQKVIVLSGMVMVGVVASVFGQTEDSLANRLPRRFVHGLGVEARPEYVFPTHPFLRGENPERKLIRGAFSTHFKYALHYQPGSIYDRIYGNVYQGIGLGCYSFGESRQIGNPVAFYLFQGARIARICPWLSFNYEWNFGLSGGWKPYDEQYNSYNKMVGSKINAYLNANFYLRWALSPRLSLTSGVTLTHFSNGNTNFPNAGVNTLGGKLGVEYNFYRKEDLTSLHAAASYLSSTYKCNFLGADNKQ
ncbi:acyloxyacyl hydrolase [Odoribacter splanchnicus]|uniref:acyloxyacyl hydrolase n=1 Tax=Odoribacter splanchnicus TaxID=28118 RepID=UPI0021D0D261|nr:acyloxyacyl hydrolase [Odoribacter splanchnicus]